MKQIIHRFLSVAVLLALTIGAWAGQTVSVNVTPNPNAGTVTKSVSDQGVCTLTVTPAQGYYLTADKLTAIATLSGEAMQAPKRSLPISDGTVLTITPDSENSDPAGVTKYTFQMPDEAFNVEVTAEFQTMTLYNLFIGETQVTELNASNVLKDGKVSFTVSGDGQDAALVYTLTLNGAAITAPLKVGLPNLTIDVQGTNTIATNETCLQAIDDASPALTFKSTSDEVGNLTMTNSDGGVSDISNVSLGRELVPVLQYYGNPTSNLYYFADGSCNQAMFVPSYGVKVGEFQVYSGNADDVLGDGTVSFNKAKGVLTLTNASISGAISTSLDNLTIELVGENSLYQGSSYASLQSMYGDAVTMTIQSTGETKGSFTMTQAYTQDGTFADSHVTLNIIRPLAIVSGKLTGNKTNENTIVIGEANGLIVAGYAVTEENSNNVLGDADSTVSYDATTNTLTLNGAEINPTNDWCIEVGEELSYLNVNLLGSNYMRGNAFKFANSKPALVFTTDDINPGSLLVGPYRESPTPYSLISPDEKNGAAVYYENGLVANVDEEQILISGPVVNLTVGGVQVTSENMGDILGDGTVSFSAKTKTLTLNGATIDMTQKDGYPIECNVEDLKVLLIGNNVLTGKDYGFKYSNASNQGTLTFTHEDNGFGSLTVNNGAIANGYTVAYNSEETGWTVAESTIGYDAIFDLQIGNTKFIASSLTITSENGSATYNPFTQTLTLKNFTTTDNVTTTLTNLTISLIGSNSVGEVKNIGESVSDTLTIQKDATSEAVVNKLIATSVNGFEIPTVVDPLNDLSSDTQVIFSDVVAYNLWVNGTQVTKENMSAVESGVSFDGDQTLMLTDVNASCDAAPFITNGLSKLTIYLVGTTNAVDCKGQLFLAKKEGDNDHQVTFATDQNNAGNLTISNVGSDWYTGHTLAYQNKLECSGEGTILIEAPLDFYGLTIAGVEVTNKNAANITGDNITAGSVSFDSRTNVLTLNEATIDGNITSCIKTLSVELKGENTMSGQFVKSESESGSGENLVFSTEDCDGKLTMGGAFVGLTAEYASKLRLSGNVITLPDTYGFSVAGIDVTPSNHKAITGTGITGEVSFNGNNTLVLKNANINGQIVVAAENELTDGLKIILIGENQITSASSCVFSASSLTNVTFALDGSQSEGSLQINSPKLWFANVNVNYTDQLALNETGLISTVLKKQTDEENPNSETDFSKSMDVQTSADNQIVGNWLITLGSEKADKQNSSGFDQTTGQVVFAEDAAMTDKELGNAMKKALRSKEYASSFKGVTGLLAAGIHSITLKKVRLEKGYDLMVKIGMQTARSLRKLAKIKHSNAVTIKKVTLKASLCSMKPVRIYTKRFSTALYANRRIGPKSSVAGGLGGISVQSNYTQPAQGPADTYKSMERSSMATAIQAVSDVHNGFSCNDPDITDLPDDMFLKTNTSSAPSRRGGAVETILPEGLTFIDFSNTKITGMEVSRTSGAFNGVPENVFIYMPAGNTTEEKNVVIGDICDVMELDGSTDAKPFKAKKNFQAGEATLKRSFTEAGTGANKVRSTIYLPYAIPQEDADELGTFYEYESNDGTTVSMKSVTTGGLKANKPYIFEAKEGGVTDPMVNVVDVLAAPVETEGFKGVYERKDYEAGMYCYAGEAKGDYKVGEFVEMGPGSYVPPFRAYMMGDNAPSYAIAWDGVVDNVQNEDIETAIETVKTVTNMKTQEGWWTISGLRLNAQPKKAGIYVFNGRLVVVK
ncbi:MAG: hypothetical protein IJ929_04310 [Prevotella sp.]|nr:hypothetical protein [Prevotella sp.]